MNNLKDLKYRFGFIVTKDLGILETKNCEVFDRWNVHYEGESAIVYHFEAIFNQYDFENHKVFILGDLFVAHGGLSICNNLRNFVENNNWDAIDNFSGRFALISFDKVTGQFDKLLTDPIGSRSIFYSTSSKGVLATHSSMLAELLSKNISEDKLNFIESSDYSKIRTKFLPADYTMYTDIFGMPANHFYCFRTEALKRFWPRDNIPPSDLTKLFNSSKEYFNNQIDYYISLGIKPMFGLTAGVDSRCCTTKC